MAQIVELNDSSEIDLDDALIKLEAVTKQDWSSARGGSNQQGGGDADPRTTAELIELITTGKSLHPAIVPLAARLVGAGTSPATTVSLIRDLMEVVPAEKRDIRWQSRFDDVPRIVESARAKFRAADERAEGTDDTLDGLVERTALDPGAPFESETVERLARLKNDHTAAFERLREELKNAGCRIGALDKAIAKAGASDDASRGPRQTDILIALAQTAELFHAHDDTAFADVDVNGHRETYPVRSRRFSRWLSHRYFEEHRGAPGSEAFRSALGVIEARAHYDGPKRPVYIRVGELEGRLYLDLCDEAWRAVEIDAAGWRVIDNPPVRFRRTTGMLPLPEPVPGGSIETLRSILNVQSNTGFVLMVAWALSCFRNRGPYPILVLSGEQGSAKSTVCANLRALIDPNTAPLRALPATSGTSSSLRAMGTCSHSITSPGCHPGYPTPCAVWLQEAAMQSVSSTLTATRSYSMPLDQ